MAMVDLMTSSRLSRSSSVTATILDPEGDAEPDPAVAHFHRRLRDVDAASSSSSYGGSAPVFSTALVPSAISGMAYLPSTVVLSELRHETFEGGNTSAPSNSGLVSKWRPKDRMKTGYVALVLCLNISVDPPDVIKISPCARLECWIDPFSMAPPKALETIGKVLSIQYERWQPKARYKVQLDPTIDEVKKLCHTCRKYAKSERVLFHYNGHGVPKPTVNGEIWLFNKSYTQYIPLPVSDLDSWLKTPSIYVFDCSAAGMIVNAFLEINDAGVSSSSGSGSTRDCILLAACEAHENLPQNSDFPADVFTSCLTTPIKMALRWFCRRSLLRDMLDYSIIDQIPGRQNDRKTLLGELNWIFTAVTDTIAWNVLPHDLFQRLFRQDLLVASLFRNFLLAERIMRSANCSPISHPMLPPTHQHHMWEAWDMAAEICLSQLPLLLEDPNAEFQPSPFFTDQLSAFEVWLDYRSERRKPPEQLPIVLQVLLSQCHRFRALVLLGRFLDRGSWEVDLALSVGIFPYVLKLLQTTTSELRQILVFIWTKILALDKSCQVDLVKDGGHMYFIRFLGSVEAYPEQRAMAAFVLAVIVDGHRRGQEACIEAGLIQLCLTHLESSASNEAQVEPLFTQWLCLCLGKLWEGYPEAQIIELASNAPSLFVSLLSEPQPEVRASAVFALGTLLRIGDGVSRDEECDDDEKNRMENSVLKSILSISSDGSPLVRAEVAVVLSRFAFGHKQHLKAVASAYWKPHSTTGLNSVPSLVNIHSTPKHFTRQPSIVTSLTRVGSDTLTLTRDALFSSTSPLNRSPILHECPLSDDSSQTSDPGISNDTTNCVLKPFDNAIYSLSILLIDKLLKDPSPRVASLARRVVSIIGVDHVVTRQAPSIGSSSSPTAILAGLARSSSWFDMHAAAHLPLSFRTPPVSPPRPSYITGMRRVCSLEFRPHLVSSPDSGLADPLLASSSDRCLLPQSTIYSWSCGHFSKPLLISPEDIEEIRARRLEKEKSALDHIAKCQHSSVSRLNNRVAGWDTRLENGVRSVVLQPFSPVVVAADRNEKIRVWNYEESVLLNSFDNHNMKEKGISNLCLANELDDALLIVGSCDGNIRIWRDYCTNGDQKLVTAFSSTESCSPHRTFFFDWQQKSGFLYATGDLSSIVVWDLDKEQLTKSVTSSSDSSVSSLSASQAHAAQFAVGFDDGSVKLFDIRTPELVVCTAKPHVQAVERVVGIGFHPGLDSPKIVSASQAGHIKFLDIRNCRDAYLTIDAFRGSLTSLAIHRHAPIIASGSAKQIIKVFSMEGEPLGAIRYQLSLMAQKIGPVNCLSFHPYQVLLAAGDADAGVSIYADEGFQAAK